MAYKRKVIHFIEKIARVLSLNSETMLHSIQLFNIVNAMHQKTIQMLLLNEGRKIKCLAIAILLISFKLLEVRGVSSREFIQVANEADDVCLLDGEQIGFTEEDEQASQIDSLVLFFEVVMVKLLHWKVSITTVSNEISVINQLWHRFIIEKESSLHELNSTSMQSSPANANLHKMVKVCIYHLDCILQPTNIQLISIQIQTISLALFYLFIKKATIKLSDTNTKIIQNDKFQIIFKEFLHTNGLFLLKIIRPYINSIENLLAEFIFQKENVKNALHQRKQEVLVTKAYQNQIKKKRVSQSKNKSKSKSQNRSKSKSKSKTKRSVQLKYKNPQKIEKQGSKKIINIKLTNKESKNLKNKTFVEDHKCKQVEKENIERLKKMKNESSYFTKSTYWMKQNKYSQSSESKVSHNNKSVRLKI